MRYFLGIGNVFFSLILGALAMAASYITIPNTTLMFFRLAGDLREWIATTTWSAQYEIMLRALVDDRQIVFMGYVLVTRIVVGLLIGLVLWLFTPKQRGITQRAA